VEQISNEIRTGYSDPDLNWMLAGIAGGAEPLSRRFSQFGDPFLLLASDFTVPSLAIHHDVHTARPEPGYLARLRETVGLLIRLAPQVFAGLGYFFDPTEILRPCF
jgi:hypothetical protein